MRKFSLENNLRYREIVKKVKRFRSVMTPLTMFTRKIDEFVRIWA